jgi:hypothetical protein
VTREEAIAVAKATAEWEGCRWSEPVSASRRRPLFSRRPVWQVRLGDHPGALVNLTIDDATGQVTRFDAPRP